jgi:hypothetical protein
MTIIGVSTAVNDKATLQSALPRSLDFIYRISVGSREGTSRGSLYSMIVQ